jgi:hypothetical protein
VGVQNEKNFREESERNDLSPTSKTEVPPLPNDALKYKKIILETGRLFLQAFHKKKARKLNITQLLANSGAESLCYVTGECRQGMGATGLYHGSMDVSQAHKMSNCMWTRQKKKLLPF